MSDPILFARLPFSVADPSLAVIPAADITNLVPYELNAWEHWMFGSDVSCLTGLKNSRVLTPQGAAPTYSANYLTLTGTYGNALRSTFLDSNAQTLAAVIQRPADLAGGKLGVLLGTISGAASGSGAYWSSPHTLTGLIRTLTGLTLGPPGVSGDWIFVAFAEKGTTTTSSKLYCGAVGESAAADAGPKTLSAKYVALGCGDYNIASTTAGVPDLPVAEMVLFDKTLTSAELGGLYARAKVRMAQRGITVL
jgi:hypothetical protein